MENSNNFVFSRALNTSYEEALIEVQEALTEEGFSVLATVDVQSTLKKKLNVDFRKYTILEACNPFYTFQALQTDLDVGLLLPCNVIIYETDDYNVYVSAINPLSVLDEIHDEKLGIIAEAVLTKLQKVMEHVIQETV